MNHAQTLKLILAAAISVAAFCAHAEPAVIDQLIRFKQITEGVNKFAPYKVAVSEYYQQSGKFPSSNSQLQIPPPEKFRDAIIDSLKIEGDGVISVKYVKFPDVANAWIHLVPDVSANNSINWHCVSNIPDIEKTAPYCHFHNRSADSDNRILLEAKVQQIAKADVKVAQKKAAGKEVDCKALKQKIDNSLQSRGIKDYQLTVLANSDASTGRIVGRCDRGANKIEYLKK